MAYALATITNPSAALTDFSLIVDLSRMPASWWAAVDTTDGTRGRVYKGDGTTRLAADWIDFDDTAETGLLRVLWSGTLATTGTQDLIIYPPLSTNDAVAADNTYGSDNVYDSDWLAYYDMQTDPSSGVADRTSNSNDGTSENEDGIVAGVIGNAIDFSGSANAGIVGPNIQHEAPITRSAWFYKLSESFNLTFFDKEGFDANWISAAFGQRNIRVTYLTSGTNGVSISESLTGDITEQWMHIAVTHEEDGAAPRIFVNGIETGYFSQTGWTGTVTDSSAGIRVGYSRFGNFGVNAYIQDYQHHSTIRSSDWISYEYDQTNDNATFWGTWSWETSGAGTDALTGADLTSGTPTLDEPTIEQTHAISGADLTSGTPTLDAPTVGQTHVLTGADLTSGVPTLDTPTLAEGTDNLTGADITSGVPTLDAPTIAQTHALTGADITSGTPTLDTPTLVSVAGMDALTGADVTSGTPTLDAPTLGQVHILTGTGILGGVSIDSPALGQAHILTGGDLTAGVPTIDAPIMDAATYNELYEIAVEWSQDLQIKAAWSSALEIAAKWEAQ